MSMAVFQGIGRDVGPFQKAIDRSITKITEADTAGLINIGEYSLYRCVDLVEARFANSVTRLLYASLFNCTALQTVVLGNAVTEIRNDAFGRDAALVSITINTVNPPTLGASAFGSTNDDFIIYVPAGSVTAYQTATNWSVYAARIQAIPS